MPVGVFTEATAQRVLRATQRVEGAGFGGMRTPRTPAPEFGAWELLGKADAAITTGNSGTISVYAGATAGSETDTGRNITAYARFADVGSGDWVICRYRQSGWEVVAPGGGSGGGSCSAQNEIWFIYVLGSPTGGTFSFDLTINSTTETLTFNYDDTSTEVDTEIDTHSEITSGDVTVTGGAFPDAAIRVEFTANLASTPIDAPDNVDWSSLTGGSGVSVVIARWQTGIA